MKDTSVVWLWLGGGPTHVETFDPKMTAPDGIRSHFCVEDMRLNDSLLTYNRGAGLRAQGGDAAAFKLPRPLLHSGNLDFSFAGLKTAVMVQAQKLGDALQERKADLAASVEAAIVEVLLKKSLNALRDTGLKRLVVAGGVGANRQLRLQLDAACARQGVRVHYPELHFCSDNGAMIAMAAAMRLQAGLQAASAAYAFDVKPRWNLETL